jgi:ferric-dicitrate binding protein FerR (iron transport regulator)
LGNRSRAALRLANQSTLRLDQNTTLVLTPGEPMAGALDLRRGAINVMTRTPRPFKVRTPFVNGGVEGTEFSVRVDERATQIVVFEGRVRAENAAGEVELAGGQAAAGAA